MAALTKEIENGRLLKNNGSWMYCNGCNKTVGYLCYSTYQSFEFNFKCQCGANGSFKLFYNSDSDAKESNEPLVLVKNRLCCPEDNSPLFTIVDKNIKEVSYSVVCKNCGVKYSDTNKN